MDDLISRQTAVDACHNWDDGKDAYAFGHVIEERIQKLPSAQPEVKPISYVDCANALMMMWIDKVLTDGEYKKIMDKLNAHEMKKREGEENERLNQQTGGDRSDNKLC